MMPILGLARLTFLECVRKRTFFVLFCVILAFVAGSAFFPATRPDDRLYLVIAWSLRAIGFFGMIVTIFVTAVSIPDDIEDRRVFTLRAKPLTHFHWMAGKILGFSVVLAVFVLASGALSLAYIRGMAAWIGTNESVNRLIAARERIHPVSLSYATDDEHRSSWGTVEGGAVDPDDLVCRVTGPAREHYLLWQFARLQEAPAGEPLRLGFHFNVSTAKGRPVQVQFRFVNPRTKQESMNVEMLSGEVSGETLSPRERVDTDGSLQVYVRRSDSESCLEAAPADLWVVGPGGARIPASRFQALGESGEAWVTTSWSPELGALVKLHGPSGGSATWHFRDLDPSDLPEGEYEVPYRLRVGGRGYATYTDVIFEIRNPETGMAIRDRRRIRYNAADTLPIRPDLVDSHGACDITLRRVYSFSYAELRTDDLSLFSRPRSFELNFLKAACLTFIQLALVMTVTVLGSTFLSAPVSLFFGGFAYLCGSMMAFLRKAQETVEATIRHAALETAGAVPSVHSHDPTEIPAWMLRFSREVVTFLLRIVPDFERMDPSSALLTGRVLSWGEIGLAGQELGIWMLLTFAIGCLVLWRREFN